MREGIAYDEPRTLIVTQRGGKTRVYMATRYTIFNGKVYIFCDDTTVIVYSKWGWISVEEE